MPESLMILLQSLGLFLLVFMFMKLMVKKPLAQLTGFQLIVYIAIGVIAAAVSLNLVRIEIGLVALGVWVLLPIGAVFLAMRNKWIHNLVEGKETVMIKQGKIMEENMQKERYTPEELLRQLRAKNVFSVADVEFAVLEATGEINSFLKSDRKPITAKDVGEKVSPQAEPQAIILDGKIMDEPLATQGLSRQWLKIELDKIGISPENIFLAQVNSSGELYIDLFDDAIRLPKPRVRELVYATLEKSKADLYSFSLDTADKEMKKIYYQDAEKLEQVLIKLRPYLLH